MITFKSPCSACKSQMIWLYFILSETPNVSSRHFRIIKLEYESLPACVRSFIHSFLPSLLSSFIHSLLNHLVQKPLGEMDQGLHPLEKEVNA